MCDLFQLCFHKNCMQLDFMGDEPTLVEVMTFCHEGMSWCLNTVNKIIITSLGDKELTHSSRKHGRCASSAPSHHLNQWWPSSQRHICITRSQWNKYLYLYIDGLVQERCNSSVVEASFVAIFWPTTTQLKPNYTRHKSNHHRVTMLTNVPAPNIASSPFY